MGKNYPAQMVLMIRPVNFGYNHETALTNSFQQELQEIEQNSIQELALVEFDNFVNLLRSHEIEVLVYEDQAEPKTPDSIFPNNWFNTDMNGKIIVFPMATVNRSLELRNDLLEDLERKYGFQIDRSLLEMRKQGHYLEGTGSLIIDHQHKVAFAAISNRTNQLTLNKYAELSHNKIVSFEAYGPKNEKIYHTNVMMCIADTFILIGLDCIAETDRMKVEAELRALDKEIIPLSKEQIYDHFAGNMLQLQDKKGQNYLIMSAKAKASLTTFQAERIAAHHNKILAPDLKIIETIGGGSARCMLAEIFYQR